jgi:nicotinate-nucleotide pyrophosphorylase (carboxylating)
MHPLNGDPAVTTLIGLALDEDRVLEDVTSLALVPSTARAQGRLAARENGRVCGLFLLEDGGPLLARFPGVAARVLVDEGAEVSRDMILATLDGPARSLLGLERTLLNFLQRLSGIATLTSRYVEAARGTRARIQETRKTCPGWRSLDKYAVACGGGLNHRRDLADQVLIKENHLVFAGRSRSPEAIREGVGRARAWAPAGTPIEVEVENLDQFRAALDMRADIVMLDDFQEDDVRRAVLLRDTEGPPPPIIEVSGGIRLERVERLARLGIDRISVGALTHSVDALDLALDVEPHP